MSQNTRVLHYLRQYGSITPLDALQALGVFRLAARVFDLNRAGHVIVSEAVPGATYVRYRLIEHAAVGHRGARRVMGQ